MAQQQTMCTLETCPHTADDLKVLTHAFTSAAQTTAHMAIIKSRYTGAELNSILTHLQKAAHGDGSGLSTAAACFTNYNKAISQKSCTNQQWKDWRGGFTVALEHGYQRELEIEYPHWNDTEDSDAYKEVVAEMGLARTSAEKCAVICFDDPPVQLSSPMQKWLDEVAP